MSELILGLAVLAFMALGLPLAGRFDAFLERAAGRALREGEREVSAPPPSARRKAG